MPQIATSFYDNGNSGSSFTIDWNNGTTQKINLSASCTLTFSNGIAGQMYHLLISQSNPANKTITWPGTVRWRVGTAPTLTSTNGRKDLQTFRFDGTTYFDYGTELNYT